MTWRPIDTAPRDIAVMLGKWESGYLSVDKDGLRWETRIGLAWETRRRLLGLLPDAVEREQYCKDYTHWMPLPEPPK